MKISIITPSYNKGAFIQETIDSVLGQRGTFALEYLIIDGGSTDQSLKIIQAAANKDPRLQWISESDRGQSDAINKGLRRATGDICAYLNADDRYLPGALQRVTDAFILHPEAIWLTGKCRITNESGKEIRRPITWYKNFFLRRYRFTTLLILNFISQPTTFWKRDVMQTVGFFHEDEHLAMDYEYWCRLGAAVDPLILPHLLAEFRSTQDNKSSQQFVEQFRRETTIAQRWTNQKWIHWLHQFHAFCIVRIYKILSTLR